MCKGLCQGPCRGLCRSRNKPVFSASYLGDLYKLSNTVAVVLIQVRGIVFLDLE
jgi:hypothetical protein